MRAASFAPRDHLLRPIRGSDLHLRSAVSRWGSSIHRTGCSCIISPLLPGGQDREQDALPRVQDIPQVEANISRAIATYMVNDPNLYPELIETAQAALEKHDPTAELDFEGVLEEDSIYPEVRAAVTNIDDPSMPVNKLGAWFLGIVSTILISGINQFFIFQSPLTSITCIIAQLVAFPLGKALALIPYKAEWPLGWFINPGPFNIKEHTLITVMATVAYGQAYATEILTVQKVYYHQEIPAGYQILLRLSTQLTGFSYAGFIRQWLV